MDRVQHLARHLREEGLSPISRRYFVSNGFDGTLTVIGVVVGAFLSGVPDGATVLKIGAGAAVGLGTSGVWSVWEIERAEKQAEIRDLERAMLADLDDTRIHREALDERIANATMSGLGPLIGVLLPLAPFAVEGALLSMLEATLASVAVAVGLLFMFGAYMGSVAGLDWRIAGVRMGLAGLVVTVVNVLLPG